jgi:3'-phosphoadenosine 5'-phosphosulfate sulfotransferase (PAPS reductase)/FAD synthetase
MSTNRIYLDKMKHIISCSFGKDSLAMLLIMIEKKQPIDEVIFFDTGAEFQAIYDTRDRVLPLLSSLGIKYTELYPDMPFFYKMFEKPVKKRGTNIIHRYGYSWCGGVCRWGTSDKLRVLEKYANGNIEYVGLAIDEPQRVAKERKGNKQFPLVEWAMTEKECLEYCYQKGFYWEEDGIRLYDILDRVSCWCCRNKNLKELKNIHSYLPTYWEKLKDLQSRLKEPMKGVGKSVFDLETRFNNERINL